MAVPPDRLQVVADVVSAHPGVNHNYEREHHYNLWFVITGCDAATLHDRLDALVPGALGFESLSAVVSGGSHDIEALSKTVGAVFSIALGTLVSWSILDAIGSRRRLADDD